MITKLIQPTQKAARLISGEPRSEINIITSFAEIAKTGKSGK